MEPTVVSITIIVVTATTASAVEVMVESLVDLGEITVDMEHQPLEDSAVIMAGTGVVTEEALLVIVEPKVVMDLVFL